jgi:Xaa-Pro dipeptidase
MPHGLGHFIGIDTHDVGGYLPGYQERIDLPGLRKLRTARIMEKDMTLTVEPGCYFIDWLIDAALAEGSPLKQYLNEERVNEYRGFGGVRLEDVVVITEDGCINYTLCPRTINEVESVMSGGKWPPLKDEMPELRRIRLTDPNPLPSPPSL